MSHSHRCLIVLCCSFFFVKSALYSQKAFELSNFQENVFPPYSFDFVSPISSQLVLRNGYQLTGDQLDLDDSTHFNNYYENSFIQSDDGWFDTIQPLRLIARDSVLLIPQFEFDNSNGMMEVEIESRLIDFDTNTSGEQNENEYDPDFRLRYFMSVFGPRLILRNGEYRYDFHLGADIIDLERPEDDSNLPDLICMCDGTVNEYLKLDNANDIDNPNGVGRKTGIHCTNGVVIEPPMGDQSLIVDQTGTGQYLTVKCDAKYPVEMGFGDRDVYISYRHMQSFASDYQIGDTLEMGEEIGKMGKSGITSNYHLHLSALRRGCDENPSQRFINVHPMYLFNSQYNPHLIQKLSNEDLFDNDATTLVQQEINPEIHFLNYDSFSPGDDVIIRIVLPYHHAQIKEIIIRDTLSQDPQGVWIFDFFQRGLLNEAERDTPYWDMNGDGVSDTVFVHHFNRGTSAQFLYDSHSSESHFDKHPGKTWPILNEGVYRTSAYILDLKVVDFLGQKNDMEIKVVDIWGHGIKGVISP